MRIAILLVVGATAITAMVIHIKRQNDVAAAHPQIRGAYDPSPVGADSSSPSARVVRELSPPAPVIVRTPHGQRPTNGWPVIVLLHGTGGSGQRFIPFADAVTGAHIAAIVPTAPTMVEADHYAWPNDLDALEAYVADATDVASSSLPIDRTRLLIGGYSSGAWVAIAIGARRPDRYRAILALAPAGPVVEPRPNPSSSPVELVMFVGRDDEPVLAAATSTEAAWTARGWPARLIPYNGGHKLPSSAPDMVKDAAASLLDRIIP